MIRSGSNATPFATDGGDVIVICAGTSWTGPRMPEHHLADQLRRRWPVLWVDPPMSHVTLARHRALGRLREGRLRVVAPDLALLRPIVAPAMTRPLMTGTTERLVRHQVRRALVELGARASVRIVASDLMLFDADAGETRVLYATDDLAAGADLIGIAANRVRHNERRQGTNCDLVVAVSPALQEKWESHAPTTFIANGCDAERFALVDDVEAATDVTLPGPIVGLVGYLSDRIDVCLLEAIADRGVSLLLVGARSQTSTTGPLDELLERSNVQWVGPKPFEDLPAYLKLIDVGVTPYVNSSFNRASFPLKTLEYLAAGRGAVVTDLPAHRWLDTDLIDITGDPTEFADAVVRRLADPLDPHEVSARRQFAARHSWASRTAQLIAALDLDQPATPAEELARASATTIADGADER